MSDQGFFKIVNPFELPKIVHEKIELNEVLHSLRKTTNKKYMPGATGQTLHNSSPDYVRSANEKYPNFPEPTDFNNSQFYAFDQHFYSTVLYRDPPTTDIFKHICFKNVCVMVNLRTEEAIVNVVGCNKFYLWIDGPDYAIALDDYVKDILSNDEL